MPSLFAASMMVLLSGTSTGRPSTSRCAIRLASYQALLLIDVVLEFFAEVLGKALHWQRGGVAQRADGAPGDVVGHRVKRFQILGPALTVLDAVDHGVKPAGDLAARRALPTGLLEVEIRQSLQSAHHAGGLVHDDHRAGAQH